MAVAKTHGCWNHSAFRSWDAMMRRCYDPKDKDFPSYGGRGIRVDVRWHDPAIFCAEIGERPKGRTLGRIDNDGPYAPRNVEWQTPLQQGANKRNNRVPGGLAAAARAAGMAESTVRNRLNRGMSLEEAVSMSNQRPRIVPRGLSELARAAGLKRETVRYRLNAGLPLNEALSRPLKVAI